MNIITHRSSILLISSTRYRNGKLPSNIKVEFYTVLSPYKLFLVLTKKKNNFSGSKSGPRLPQTRYVFGYGEYIIIIVKT